MMMAAMLMPWPLFITVAVHVGMLFNESMV